MSWLERSKCHQSFIGGCRCELAASGECSDVDAAVMAARRTVEVGEWASVGRRSVNILRQNAFGCHMERICQTRL